MTRSPDPLAPLKKRTHKDLVREVLRACNQMAGVTVFPVGVTMIRIKSGGWAQFGMTGTPDILGWKVSFIDWGIGKERRPIPIAFECKVGKDKLRKEQQAFLDRARADGVICGEIRSAEQAVKLLGKT